METQSFFAKNKKLLIISGVVGVALILAVVALILLTPKNNTSNNNNSNDQTSSQDGYGDFLPANTCPDSTKDVNGNMVAVLNGKDYLVTQENIAYMDKNCKKNQDNNSAPSDPNTGAKYLALENCVEGGKFLDVFPVDVNSIDVLTPLGNITPPDHTIPTDHIYFMAKRTSPGFEGQPVPFTVRSPGNIVVTGISRTVQSKNGTLVSDDYGMEFAGCKGILFYFGHIKVLTNPTLKAEYAKLTNCQKATQSGSEIENCINSTDFTLSSGEEIGTTVGDLGAYNFEKKLPFINQTIYPVKMAYALCPLDYFIDSVQQEAYRIMNRSGEPLCGSIMQDLPGTLQGNWFYGDTTKYETYSVWNNHMSIVHDNVDPTIVTIAVASTDAGPKMLMFKPRSTGNMNPEVSRITPGNTVYCFASDQESAKHRYVTGSLLVQLKSETKVAIQWQDGDCSNMNMTSPKEYQR